MKIEKGFIKNIHLLSYVVLPRLLPHPHKHIHTIPNVVYNVSGAFRMLLTKLFLTHLKRFKHMSKISKIVLPFLLLLDAYAQ